MAHTPTIIGLGSIYEAFPQIQMDLWEEVEWDSCGKFPGIQKGGLTDCAEILYSRPV